GALVAGDWQRSDGVQTIYHHGSKPQLQLAPNERAGEPLTFDSVWQLSPSAREFALLVGDTSVAQIGERPNTFVITFSAKAVNGSDRVSASLVKATLIVNRSDLHPIEETLLITQANETREYTFTETAFEKKTSSTVAPAVFEPEAELLGAGTGRRGHVD